MKLYIIGKFFSFHRKLYVKDENNRNIYEISNRFFTMGHKTTICTPSGKEVAYIRQKLLRIMPTYDVFVCGKFMCRIKRKLNFMKRNYSIDNGYELRGSLMDLNFDLYDASNKKVASIRKKFLSFTEKYELEIENEKDALLALSIIATISNDSFDESTNSYTYQT